MSFQAQLVMILWIPIVFYFFKRFRSYQAVAISFVIGWLFLPQKAGFYFLGFPDYERVSALSYSVLLASLFFHIDRFQSLKVTWFDIPIIVLCLSPLFSSISNGLGVYDGISGVIGNIVQYGIPYFLGRIFLNHEKGLYYLTKTILVGALLYLPLCLYEIRMSPQLHQIIYGYPGIRQFSQGIRYGGYRPNVFMRHGLSVGVWMMAGTLIAFWLWQSGILKKMWNIHIPIITLILLITFILVKSTAAYLYLFYGLIVLFCAKKFRLSFPLIFLGLLICGYLFLASTGQINQDIVDNLVSSLSNFLPEDRVGSLEFRLDNEQILLQRALERPLFGWGGWGRNRVFVETFLGEMKDSTTTDSLWIISFGKNGWVGLISVFAILLVPVFYFCYKYPAKLWFTSKIASPAILTTLLSLYALDCLLNAQFNPVFILIAGGLSGYFMKVVKYNLPSRRSLSIVEKKKLIIKL
jgi:hypothetical protein